ncbi:MAG: peptidylprolyl isomerase [Chromatiales bacterium]|jgi:cyclophilin family peptidyl-prolyl cis-trans isomerase|nr:peptidylprolyl isomerase [Chromatiales bacterium]MDH3894061.1 peptidylprolyl isomerase [Chromatiales bacterium]MDH3932427.1 peptidylprolyl isomerase [Chromatiales bacterium]MDH3945513.1 peptidylprolyl isomerase [Chromatiales bacterium]MDH4012821.1 peptidylprolyl isomerase [Chromatiales bacterium]
MRGLLLTICLSLALPAMAQEMILPDRPRVRIDTSEGSIVIELDAQRAPLTSANFIRYVQDGFYEGLIFHRVINNFVAQGGGYTPDHVLREPTRDPVPNEAGNGLSNLRGTVGMARTSKPHSATTQFYFNLADNEDLDPLPTRWGYTVFGTIVEGIDVVDRIAHVPTGPSMTSDDLSENVPEKNIVIQGATFLNPLRVGQP